MTAPTRPEPTPDEPPITDAWIYPRAVGGVLLLALPLALAVIGALCVPGWGSL